MLAQPQRRIAGRLGLPFRLRRLHAREQCVEYPIAFRMGAIQQARLCRLERYRQWKRCVDFELQIEIQGFTYVKGLWMNSKVALCVLGPLHLLLFVVYYFQSQCARTRIRSLIRCTAEAIGSRQSCLV